MIKKILKSIMRKAGWELHRISVTTRSSMNSGLLWLSKQGFKVNTILDVGASNGCWSKECMNFFPAADYILFEPQPVHGASLDYFSETCKQKVSLVKKAVGASEGKTFFDASEPFSGALTNNEKGNSVIEVELTTIDASLSKLKAVGPYLLKLDTHGFEKSILNGACHTLEQTEILIIEAYNYKITDETLLFWELCAFLSEKGFRPIDLVDVMHRLHDNSLWQMDIFFVRSGWSGFKYTSYK